MLTSELNYVYELIDNGKVKHLIGNTEKLTIPNQSTTVNTIINIPITYEKFETDFYITDTVNKTVEVYLDGVLQGTTEIVNGIGNIEFVSAEVGEYTLTVDGTSVEVIVNAN